MQILTIAQDRTKVNKYQSFKVTRKLLEGSHSDLRWAGIRQQAVLNKQELPHLTWGWSWTSSTVACFLASLSLPELKTCHAEEPITDACFLNVQADHKNYFNFYKQQKDFKNECTIVEL